MVQKLEDHWLDVDKTMDELRQKNLDADVRLKLSAHILKHLEANKTIVNAEFSEVIEQKPLTSIDTYA